MLWMFLPAALADLAPFAPSPDAIGARVVRGCGDVYALEELSFTFIAVKGGEEKARRSHRWRPQDGTLTVTVGEEVVALALHDPLPTEGPALEAWSAFVNDSYWLLAPCKVMDPGVERRASDDNTLFLGFEGVGLTPGDRYTMRLSGTQVRAWQFTLESGRIGDFVWSPYEPVGPMRLSLQRDAVDGSVQIRFEDVTAR
ncbi:MAG: hypothetical protein ACI8S6_001612 [Myxococcota bacterium]|jgi:hypothetical protein